MKRIIAEIRQYNNEYKLFINDTLCGKFNSLIRAKQQAQYFTGKNREYGYIRHIIQLESK